MNQLKELIDLAVAARGAVENEMLRLFPRGTVIEFMIMNGQRNASTGTVVRAGSAIGCVFVMHHQAKKHSRYAYREVHYTRIMART